MASSWDYDTNYQASSVDAFWLPQKESLYRLKTELESSLYRSKLSSDISKIRKPRPPRLSQLNVPPESPRLRGQHYDVVPPVTQRTKPKRTNRDEDYDSWSEDHSDSDESDDDNHHPVLPNYPMIVYPMVLSTQPTSSRHRQQNGAGRKMKLMNQYVINPNDGRSGQLKTGHRRHRSPNYSSTTRHGDNASKKHSGWSDVAAPAVTDQIISDCLDEDFIPDLLIEVINEAELQSPANQGHKEFQDSTFSRFYVPSDAVQDFLDDLFEDVIAEEAISILREYNFRQSAGEDRRIELLNKTKKSFEEATMTTTHRRGETDSRNNAMQVESLANDKVVESMLVDYMMSIFAKQNQLVTKEQYANQMLDDVLLNVLIDQYNDVSSKRSSTVDNKTLRNLHEKAVTDVALDVVMKELIRSLDADMTDIDFNERSVVNI